ncbi:hypothetical protein, partial [Streptomyces graminilatus]|uniref:hypothetical protein n=1 Tax=Streptomyces graminilatus TaxID=1464070 RepID=UPI0019D6CA61
HPADQQSRPPARSRGPGPTWSSYAAPTPKAEPGGEQPSLGRTMALTSDSDEPVPVPEAAGPCPGRD